MSRISYTLYIALYTLEAHWEKAECCDRWNVEFVE